MAAAKAHRVGRYCTHELLLPPLCRSFLQITHGRVAMLAAVGWLVQEVWHPLFGGTIEGDSFMRAPCLDAFLRSRSAHLSFRLPSARQVRHWATSSKCPHRSGSC